MIPMSARENGKVDLLSRKLTPGWTGPARGHCCSGSPRGCDDAPIERPSSDVPHHLPMDDFRVVSLVFGSHSSISGIPVFFLYPRACNYSTTSVAYPLLLRRKGDDVLCSMIAKKKLSYGKKMTTTCGDSLRDARRPEWNQAAATKKL
jgi:hypothetical protein